MDDLISVIVPVYNLESVLERTLACVVNQTYRKLEIILVDDGSTDSSGKICDDFANKDSRCTVIHINFSSRTVMILSIWTSSEFYTRQFGKTRPTTS